LLPGEEGRLLGLGVALPIIITAEPEALLDPPALMAYTATVYLPGNKSLPIAQEVL
jgi:hypothetical protein